MPFRNFSWVDKKKSTQRSCQSERFIIPAGWSEALNFKVAVCRNFRNNIGLRNAQVWKELLLVSPASKGLPTPGDSPILPGRPA
ncbi:MAG: hypothetical protein JWL59_3211 [Chthoniobacteraceae bacterium]|nr:hypothetical protein [Chthoniobacteraceae bacterium]